MNGDIGDGVYSVQTCTDVGGPWLGQIDSAAHRSSDLNPSNRGAYRNHPATKLRKPISFLSQHRWC